MEHGPQTNMLSKIDNSRALFPNGSFPSSSKAQHEDAVGEADAGHPYTEGVEAALTKE